MFNFIKRRLFNQKISPELTETYLENDWIQQLNETPVVVNPQYQMLNPLIMFHYDSEYEVESGEEDNKTEKMSKCESDNDEN